MAAEDSWEQLKLEELSLKDTSTPVAPESQQQQQQQQQQQEQVPLPVPVSQEQSAFAAELHLASPEEQAVLYALAGQHERMHALRIEEDVLAFIGDTNRDVLEFPTSYGNYQRLLAHKVAQYHGLQTSTADYEGSTGRVVAHRKCVETKSRPRLSQLVVSPSTVAAAAAQQQQQFSKGSMGGTGVLPDPRPRLLLRPSGAEGRRNGPETDRQPVARSAKDREEEYNKARQRIIGEAPISSPLSTTPSPTSAPPNSAFVGIGNGGSGNGAGGGRGSVGGRFMGGRGAGGGMGGGMVAGGFQGSGFRGRGRKGGRGDRNAELQQDPDYMRGPNRYGPAGAYDPTAAAAAAAAANGYMVPPAMYTMPYVAEAGRDMSGASMYPTSMPSPAAAAAGAMSPHAAAAANRAPPPPPLSMQPSLGSSGKFSSAASTPTSLLPPPPPPHGAAALPTPTPYPTPAAHPAAPYPAMTSMAMAYPPAMMPPGAPPMYGAMHPAAAYPYPPQMGVTPTPPTPYPGTPYPGADPMAAAMQSSYPMMAHPHMHAGYPMMAHPHMHPGMAPAMAMGRGMHAPPYPGAMMPQAPYPPMQQDSMFQAAAAAHPAAAAAMYHQSPYGPGMYGQQASHSYGSSMYGGGGGNQSYYGGGRGRGRGTRDHHDSYQGGQGRGRGGGNNSGGFAYGNSNHSNSNHHVRSFSQQQHNSSADTGSSSSPSHTQAQQQLQGPSSGNVGGMPPTPFTDPSAASGASHFSNKGARMAHVAAAAGEPMGSAEVAQKQQQQQDGPVDGGEGR